MKAEPYSVKGSKMSQASGQPRSPKAPGAVVSPQRPGKTPDQTGVPGFIGAGVPKVAGPVLRPRTQYGTAQEIIHVFPEPNEEAVKEEFEQAPASIEEMRKAYPWQIPPIRPTSVFALDQGVSPEAPSLPEGESAPQLQTGE
jgi:hypothetical protein